MGISHVERARSSMSDTDNIIIMMKVIANEKTSTASRMITRTDEIRRDQFDFVEFEFGQLSAPLKDLVLPLLDDRYDGPVTITVEARAGDKVFTNEQTFLNSKLKKIVRTQTSSRGLILYGSQQQELEKQLVNVLFNQAAKPVKESLKEDIKN
jgi:hypothetical protein